MQHQLAAMHPEAAHLTNAALLTLALWLAELTSSHSQNIYCRLSDAQTPRP